MRFQESKDGEEYELTTPSDKCTECLFQCVVIIKKLKLIDISCKHPKGPGKPEHCIYFKKRKSDKLTKQEKVLNHIIRN